MMGYKDQFGGRSFHRKPPLYFGTLCVKPSAVVGETWALTAGSGSCILYAHVDYFFYFIQKKNEVYFLHAISKLSFLGVILREDDRVGG